MSNRKQKDETTTEAAIVGNTVLYEVVLSEHEKSVITKNYLNTQQHSLASWEFIRIWVSKKGNIMVQKFWEDDYEIQLLDQVNLGAYSSYNFA